jgi:uracil-DNA glycosylase
MPLFDPLKNSDYSKPNHLITWPPTEWQVHPSWRDPVQAFAASAQGLALTAFLRERLAQGAVIYPPEPLRALALTPLSAVRVVILGQDPYHGAGQAEGLAFSIRANAAVGLSQKWPPSLRNIFKELIRDGLLSQMPMGGSLVPWAQQGVLLLNSAFTVEDGQAASHAHRGWESLSDRLLSVVADQAPHCVYLLWGAAAQQKRTLIEQACKLSGQQALLLCANHPSPLSALRGPAPFIGCGHFRQTADWLGLRGTPLDWRLP